MAHTSVRRRVLRVTAQGDRTAQQDTLATEEPLEIRLDGAAFTTTMRTPGHDLELALGFLVGEGVVATADDVVSAVLCPDASPGAEGPPGHNVVDVVLAGTAQRPEPARHRHVNSACGVCGTASVEAVRSAGRYRLEIGSPVEPGVVAALPATMRAAQRVFERTGGLHAAALFAPGGELRCLREDVGRHNAVDKVIGWSVIRRLLPLSGSVLQVSGRASFELVQKAWSAGCPVLAAVSAPSSLAAELAEQVNLTLLGFSRGDRFTVYSGAERIAGP